MHNRPRFLGVSQHVRLQMDSLCRHRKTWDWEPAELDQHALKYSLGTLGSPPKYVPSRSMNDLVTVIIPTHRQEPVGLSEFLADPAVLEVIVLANGSFHMNENREQGLRVISCPWLGHGQTRQYAIQFVQTPFVLFSVDDAIPWGNAPISCLLDGFLSGEWDAAVSRQVPWPSAPLYLHHRLVQWMKPVSEPTLFSQCDHVTTLYKTERLVVDPLPDVSIAEDLHWSVGKKICLVGDSLVLHSHRPSVRDLWRRERRLARQRLQLNIGPKRHLSQIVQHAIGAGIRQDWASLLYEGTETIAQWSIQKRFSLRHPRA